MKRSRILTVILLALVLALASAATACSSSAPHDAAPFIEDSEQVSFKSTSTGRWYHVSEFILDGRRYLLVETSSYGNFQVIPLE